MDKFKKHINLERTFYSWYNYKNELPIDHKWITYLNLAFATNFENLNGGKQFNEQKTKIIANLQSLNIEYIGKQA